MSLHIQDYLPSKNFFITIGAAVASIAVVLGIMALIQRKKSTPTPVVTIEQNRLLTNEEVARNLQILEQIDSDDDGLYDWEEALWGTDPMNPDTDQDGINDRDEVNQVKIDGNLTDNPIPQEDLTPVDVISRDLYSTIAILDQQGKLQDAESQIKDFFQESIIASLPTPTTTLAELVLVSDTIESRNRYSEDLRRIIQQYGIEEQDFLFIMNNSSSLVKTPESLNIIEKYTQFTNELQMLEVPVGIQREHINFFNVIKNLRQNLDIILYSDQDPLESFAATLQMSQVLVDYDTTLTLLFRTIAL